MTEPGGRRERKKEMTRQKIADAALRLFLERGYDAVGIRDVAAEADVAVTTLFSHYPSKEALAFGLDQDFERQLVRAVTDRPPRTPLVDALRDTVRAMVRHCSAAEAAPLWNLIDTTPALLDHERTMRLRHAESLAAAVAADLALPPDSTACRALARFVVDAFSLAREADDPDPALDEVFRMIDAAWQAVDR